MIEFIDVSFSYGKKKILENFSLEINDGDRICLFAPSGFGKSTILRLIMGLEKPKSGKIRGKENLKISAVFQEDRLIPQKTVSENLALFGGEDKIPEILENLNLRDTENLYPNELSGGMARRIAIARALNYSGDVFILDEPFNGIDKENILKTAEYIKNKTNGKTVIAVTHSTEEAQLLGTKIIELG